MSSLPSVAVSFRPSSVTSSVVDAVESYRRAQTYLADAASLSTSGTSEDEAIEEGPEDEESLIADHDRDRSQDVSGSVVSNLQWDEDLTPTTELPRTPFPPAISESGCQDAFAPSSALAEERTPLLRKSTISSTVSPPSRASTATVTPAANQSIPVTLPRADAPVAAQSKVPVENQVGKPPAGHSTFGQTLFNSIAILLGIGMLSEPLAFAYAGWIGGTLLLVGYGFITCYTAKILAHIILDDARLKSYADIGRKAFGPRSTIMISILFCVELFAVSVALVTLFADSLYAVWPAYSPDTYKIFCLVFLVPTVLMPLSVLSYASMIGLLSTLLIIAVILIDGFAKPDAPGSLWSPADTSLSFRSVGELGISFGLFMAGFSGHVVIPSLARDMVDPSQFDTMIDYAFAIATAIYAVIGVAGYIMFGNSVSDEFSVDLMKYSVYSTLNEVALWGLVLTPISKYALATRPLNITFEVLLGLETNAAAADDHGTKPTTSNLEQTTARKGSTALRTIFIALERTTLAVLSVAVSICIPGFSSMMAFLGACTSFLLCVVGPISAKAALAKYCGFWDGLAIFLGAVMAIWGTAAAIWSST